MFASVKTTISRIPKMSAPWAHSVYKAGNPNNPLFTLSRLSHSADLTTRLAAISSIVARIEEGFYPANIEGIRRDVFADALSAAKVLGEKMSPRKKEMFSYEIEHFIRGCDTSMLERISMSKNPFVRSAIAGTPGCPKPVLMDIAMDKGRQAIKAWSILFMRGLKNQDLWKLYLSRNTIVQCMVAGHQNADRELLQRITLNCRYSAVNLASERLRRMGLISAGERLRDVGSPDEEGMSFTMHSI